MTKPLFDSFDEVSAQQWKQKIQVDLKGADYNETLIYKSLEGIDIKPFYHKEDIEEIQNNVEHPSSWLNSIKIDIDNASSGNQNIVAAIKKGAESVHLIIDNIEVDPEELLNEIPKSITILIEAQFLSAPYCSKINQIAEAKNLNVYLVCDIINHLAATGNWYTNLKNDFEVVSEINQNNSLKTAISVDISLYQNSGANIVQQLAYGLAHANEYLNHFDKGDSSDKNKMILFKIAVGSNYFFEIAKLRALRLLWHTLSSEYTMFSDCYILAYPSHRNKTILDYNVNMLRTTTECMSAVLGGADLIQNVPYDDIYHHENEFGTRISLNQLLLLKNESYFDIVDNPASGTYYIEHITSQIAEKALSLFKNIEEGGGFLAQLKAGTIQKKIKESAEKEQELFDEGKIILTGSNVYQNPNEHFPELQKTVFPQKKSRKTLLEPILKRRLSEEIEKKILIKR